MLEIAIPMFWVGFFVGLFAGIALIVIIAYIVSGAKREKDAG